MPLYLLRRLVSPYGEFIFFVCPKKTEPKEKAPPERGRSATCPLRFSPTGGRSGTRYAQTALTFPASWLRCSPALGGKYSATWISI